MRLESHENLMVWSIRHERFDLERLDSIFHQPHHRQDAFVHQAERCDRWEPCVDVHIVDLPHRPEPADCWSYRCGETTLGVYPPDKAYPAAIPMPEIDIVTIPADIAPPSAPGALQGYIYGQAVPTSGNLLDVMA